MPPQAAPASRLVCRSWGTDAGLPQNTVNSIVQARDGYLWLATRDGLARFDGVRFTVFGLEEGLRTVDVSCLYEDRNGTLWVGTAGGGLSRWANGRIEPVGEPSRRLAGDDVACLAEDAEGRLWIGTSAGLAIREADQFIQVEALAPLARTSIRAVLAQRDGTMWIATRSQGLFEFKAGQLKAERGPAGNELIQAYCLAEDAAGQVWASIGNGQVLCRQAGSWRVYNQSDGLPFAYVTTLVADRQGRVWAGSLDDGLYCFEEGRFHPIRTEHGLSANDIRSLLPDREGNLWVGTRTGGLNRLSQRKLVHVGSAQGLTNDFTRGLAQTADGVIWVATTGGGLYRGSPAGFAPFTGPIISFYAQAETVLATADGSLWWGGARGLLRWQDGALTGTFTNAPWVRAAIISALCEDPRGGLWIGNSEGTVVRYEKGQFTPVPHRLARGPVTALVASTNGWLWVGSTGGGLRGLDTATDSVRNFPDGLASQSIRTLYLDSAGVLWIGTAGGGLGRLRDGRIFSFTARHGLGANTVSQIVEDDYGHLWLGANRGILRVRKSELDDLARGAISFLHPRAYGLNDGMPAEECSGGFSPAGLKTREGLICFSTVRGLIFLDPHQQEEIAPSPTVLLEEVLVNGKPVPPPGGSGGGARQITVPPGGRELELRYTGLSYGSPEKVSFRYRLEGLEREWVEAGTRRAAYYSRVPPGDYVFRVIACNADGLWNETGATLALTLEPYLWQTRSFLAAVILLALGATAAILRLLERRRYRRQLAILETRHAVERERLRIAQDMHDHIGGMLTQVSQLSDLGLGAASPDTPVRAHLERIGVQSRAAVQALDEIIWATNPKNDNLPRFAEYVSRFADEFFEASPVRCWQDMPADLPDLPLRADLRHNIFLAIREAFHNVLKHSAAASLWLRLALSDGQVRIEIEDNGRGFDRDTVSPGGNGLENMRSRLAECGGRMTLESAPGKGTKVQFAFPL